MKDADLVSIVVVSYNSSQTIIDTLESIKKQTHKNIEVIITDDNSSDDTIEITRKWLHLNGDSFSNYCIETTNNNTGITLNCNRGLKKATGKYVKIIAADDILLENCIKDLYAAIEKKSLNVIFSKAIPFTDSNAAKDIKYVEELKKNELQLYKKFFNQNANKQLNDIVMMRIPLSMIIGTFFLREYLKKENYFDEKYIMMEDYPFLFKTSIGTQRLDLLDTYTVKYRTRAIDDLNEFKKSYRYISHYNNLKEFRRAVIIPALVEKRKYFLVIYLKVLMKILEIEFNSGNSKKNSFINILRKIKKSLIK